jgi:hypothetical protein
MRDGSVAHLGAKEIATCLYRHLMGETFKTPKVVLTSDSCCGQNKNLSVNARLHMKDRLKITSIGHKFLEPGHTHIECDADHGTIEKKQKRNHESDFSSIQLAGACTFLRLYCLKYDLRAFFGL